MDRQALPLPQYQIEAEYVAPRTETEYTIVNIWADVLKLPRKKIGICNNFFDLGGHSFLATKIISKLRKNFSVNCPLSDIYDFPTITGLADKIDNFEIKSNYDILIKLNEEAILEENICATTAKYPCVGTPQTALLTGSTGFIGRFLLHELLQKSTLVVCCLLRGNSEEEAFERLKKKMLINKLWREKFAERVKIILGDMGKNTVRSF